MGNVKVPFALYAYLFGRLLTHKVVARFRKQNAAASEAEQKSFVAVLALVVILGLLAQAQTTAAKAEKERLEREVAAGRITLPPGAFLLAVAEFLFSSRSLDDVLRPTIADMRREYNDALVSSRLWKARWVRVRGTWAFLSAAILIVVGSVGSIFVRVWRLIA